MIGIAAKDERSPFEPALTLTQPNPLQIPEAKPLPLEPRTAQPPPSLDSLYRAVGNYTDEIPPHKPPVPQAKKKEPKPFLNGLCAVTKEKHLGKTDAGVGFNTAYDVECPKLFPGSSIYPVGSVTPQEKSGSAGLAVDIPVTSNFNIVPSLRGAYSHGQIGLNPRVGTDFRLPGDDRSFSASAGMILGNGFNPQYEASAAYHDGPNSLEAYAQWGKDVRDRYGLRLNYAPNKNFSIYGGGEYLPREHDFRVGLGANIKF